MSPLRRLHSRERTAIAIVLGLGAAAIISLAAGVVYDAVSRSEDVPKIAQNTRHIAELEHANRTLIADNARLLAVEADAYCKLKLYDELSAVATLDLFGRLGLLTPRIRSDARSVLKLVASIPSSRVCDASLKLDGNHGKTGIAVGSIGSILAGPRERQRARAVAPSIRRPSRKTLPGRRPTVPSVSPPAASPPSPNVGQGVPTEPSSPAPSPTPPSPPPTIEPKLPELPVLNPAGHIPPGLQGHVSLPENR